MTARKSIPPALHLAVCMRDGFVDRLDSGKPLYFTPFLRLAALRDPVAFPYDPYWKTAHPDFWNACATANHVLPVAGGGTNDIENLICTAMKPNMRKGCRVFAGEIAPPGDLRAWDGGLQEFVDEVAASEVLRKTLWIKPWFRVALVAGLTPRRLTGITAARVLVVAVLLAIAGPAIADSSMTSRRMGGTTYHNGQTSSGQTFTGSSRQMGNQTYSTFREGNRTTNCTTRTLSSQTTTSCR